jgi:hypothetical protein
VIKHLSNDSAGQYNRLKWHDVHTYILGLNWNNIKMDLKEMGCEGVDLSFFGQVLVEATCEYSNEP